MLKAFPNIVTNNEQHPGSSLQAANPLKLIITSSKPPTVQIAINFHEGRRACDHAVVARECDHATRSMTMWLCCWACDQALPTLGGHTSFSLAITYGAKIERNSYKCIWFSHSKCEAHYFYKTIYLKLQHYAAASKTMWPCCCKHGDVTNTHDLHMSLRASFLDQIWLRCSWFYEIHQN